MDWKYPEVHSPRCRKSTQLNPSRCCRIPHWLLKCIYTVVEWKEREEVDEVEYNCLNCIRVGNFKFHLFTYLHISIGKGGEGSKNHDLLFGIKGNLMQTVSITWQ